MDRDGRCSADPLAPISVPKAVQNEVQQLLRAKIIEPSMSPWASPIVLVPKRDGTLCLYVDYRWKEVGS